MTKEELLSALRAADAAGDAEAARTIAGILSRGAAKAPAPAAVPAPPGGLPNVTPEQQRARDDNRVKILQNELAAETAAGRADNVASITKELQNLGVKVVAPTVAPVGVSQPPANVSGQPAAPAPVPNTAPALPSGPDSPPKPVLGPGGFAKALEQETAGLYNPGGTRFLAGIGTAPVQAYQSIQQLAGVDVPKNEIEEQRALASGWAGGAGNLVGNVAMSYIPGGFVLKNLPKAAQAIQATKAAVSQLPKAVQAALTSSVVPAGAAVQGGLLTPVIDDESRAANAGWAALFGKGLQAGGRALTGLVKPTEQAEQLMKQGIQPTIQQGGSGILGRTLGQVEEVAANLPYIGKWVQQGQRRTAEEAKEVMAGQAQFPQLPAVKAAPGRGEFFEELKHQVETVLHSSTANVRAPVGKAITDTIAQAGRQELRDVPTTVATGVEKDIKGLLPKTRGRVAVDRFITAEDAIQERITSNLKLGTVEGDAKARAYQEALKELVAHRNSVLSADQIAIVTDMQVRKQKGRLLQKAAGYAKEGTDTTTAQNIIKAVEAETPEVIKAEGKGLYQGITDPLKSIVEKDKSRDALVRRAAYMMAGTGLGVGTAIANPIAAVAGIPLYLGARLGASRLGASLAMGGTEAQQKLAELMRRYRGAAAVAAGSEGQREDRYAP